MNFVPPSHPRSRVQGRFEIRDRAVPMRLDPERGWVPATPLGPQGPIAKVEWWCRRRGWTRVAGWLGRLDELGL